MPLSKNQVLGIAASLVWAVAALTAVMHHDYSRALIEVQTTRVLCLNLIASRNVNASACREAESRTWDNWTRETTLRGLGLAILPIPFGWLFADLLVWLSSKLASISNSARVRRLSPKSVARPL